MNCEYIIYSLHSHGFAVAVSVCVCVCCWLSSVDTISSTRNENCVCTQTNSGLIIYFYHLVTITITRMRLRCTNQFRFNFDSSANCVLRVARSFAFKRVYLHGKGADEESRRRPLADGKTELTPHISKTWSTFVFSISLLLLFLVAIRRALTVHIYKTLRLTCALPAVILFI